MATAGSGDVLAGMIAGLSAGGISPTEAARLGVYIHGLAGDRAKKRYGKAAITAGSLIDEIGPIMSSYV
jgi:NAD(P)H-hydrate repair Nnr-like enzyme with NAD(P)H-hydrate dehydratase domain